MKKTHSEKIRDKILEEIEKYKSRSLDYAKYRDEGDFHEMWYAERVSKKSKLNIYNFLIEFQDQITLEAVQNYKNSLNNKFKNEKKPCKDT